MLEPHEMFHFSVLDSLKHDSSYRASAFLLSNAQALEVAFSPQQRLTSLKFVSQFNKYDVARVQFCIAANQDKVEEKAAKELEDKSRAGKNSAEMEKELNSQDVGYKIKDETGN
jgi:hypothetical protein